MKLTDLHADDHNANKGTERGAAALEASLRRYGAGRSILVDRNGRIIAGNKTVQAAGAMGMDDVIVVQSDGTKIIAVQRTDLDLNDKAARELAYADNRVGQLDLDWDIEALMSDMTAGIELAPFFSDDELAPVLDMIKRMDAPDAIQELPPRAEEGYAPDAVWPSNNDYEIPTLDLNMQAVALDQPAHVWGTVPRTARHGGAWLFYTEDYRYEQLWKEPGTLLQTKALSATEPNFSAYENMPLPVALWSIYRKRWIARYWQSQGVRVFADLNVAVNWAHLNRLGIPAGWKAFSTRGYESRLDSTHSEYAIAQEIAGDGVTPLFVVYGGGKAVKAEAKRMGWLWVPERMDVMRKKEWIDG